MAIDLGRFGNVVAQPVAQQAARIVSGAEALGAINGVAEAYLQQQTVKAEQERQDLNRGRSAVMLSEYGNAINDIHTALADEVRTGKLPAEKTVEEFKRRADERIGSMLDPLDDKEFSEQLRPMLQAYQIKGLETAGTVQTQYVRLGHGMELDKAAAETSKLFISDPTTASSHIDAAADTLGLKAGLNSAQIAQFKAQKKADGWMDNRQFWLENTGDLAALAKEREELNAGAYPDITNDQRLALLHATDTKIRTITNLQEAERRESMRADVDYVQATTEQVKNGITPNAATIARMSEIKARTPDLANQIDTITGASSIIGALNSMPMVPTDKAKDGSTDAGGQRGYAAQSQQGIVELLTKQYESATTLEEKEKAQQQLAIVSAAVKNNAEAWQKNPYIKLQEVTGKPVTLLDPMRGDFAQQLQGRLADQRKAAAVSGLSIPMMSNDEAKQTVSILKSEQVPANAKMNIIKILAASSKQDPNGTIGAFASEEPAIAAALAAEQMGISYRSGGVMRPVSADIMRGLTLAQNKEAVANLTNPPDAADAPRWKRDKKAIEDGYIGDAYAQNATGRAQVVKLSETIYLSLAEQHQGEMTAEEHQRLRKVSLQLATGNIYTINGHQVPSSFGLDENSFNRQVRDQLTALASKGQKPTPVYDTSAFGAFLGMKQPENPIEFKPYQPKVDSYEWEIMNNSHLVQVGQGTYRVYIGRDMQIDKDGKPLLVTVKPPK